jgi:predicted MFS family arabinose efflux permease
MSDSLPAGVAEVAMPEAAPGNAGVSSLRFNAFLAGMTLSRLGDVVFAVALPWLALQVSGSNVALGTLMTVFAIPRGLLLLVGGAVSDRFSARNVLLVSNLAQALCVAAIAGLLAAHAFRLDMLYVLVFAFGVADAFATPAVNTLVPDLVARDGIPRANALVQSATQVCMLAGSALAGVLIQYGGLTTAFVVDALSFVAILLALAIIPAVRRDRAPETGLREAIAAGLRHVWADPALRGLFVLCACVNFCVTGVSEIGLVVLAKSRFDSAAALGFLMTSIGIGSLLGIAAGSKLPSTLGVGATLRGASVALGALFALLAVPMPLLAVCGVALGIGVAAGCVNFKAITWLQMDVPADVTGRVMSVFAFASAGVMPLSLMIAGWLAQSHLATLMLSSAALLVLTALVARPGARRD